MSKDEEMTGQTDTGLWKSPRTKQGRFCQGGGGTQATWPVALVLLLPRGSALESSFAFSRLLSLLCETVPRCEPGSPRRQRLCLCGSREDLRYVRLYKEDFKLELIHGAFSPQQLPLFYLETTIKKPNPTFYLCSFCCDLTNGNCMVFVGSMLCPSCAAITGFTVCTHRSVSVSTYHQLRGKGVKCLLGVLKLTFATATNVC